MEQQTFSAFLQGLTKQQSKQIKQAFKERLPISDPTFFRWETGVNEPLPCYHEKIDLILVEFGHIQFFNHGRIN